MRSGPSDAAVEVARTAYRDGRDVIHPDPLGDALVAAHDATLGVDRSVCLRDLLEFLREGDPFHPDGESVARFLEQHFTQREDPHA